MNLNLSIVVVEEREDENKESNRDCQSKEYFSYPIRLSQTFSSVGATQQCEKQTNQIIT